MLWLKQTIHYHRDTHVPAKSSSDSIRTVCQNPRVIWVKISGNSNWLFPKTWAASPMPISWLSRLSLCWKAKRGEGGWQPFLLLSICSPLCHDDDRERGENCRWGLPPPIKETRGRLGFPWIFKSWLCCFVYWILVLVQNIFDIARERD